MRSFVSDTATASASEPFDPDSWDVLASCMTWVNGDVTKPELYQQLAQKLDQVAAEYGTQGNVIFYLAVASSLFGPIVERLGEAGLIKEDKGWRRVIIEKPFGTDLDSARALDQRILGVLSESQIYRMDHFLGRKRSKTSWFCASRTAFSSRYGTATILITQMVAETVGVSDAAIFTRRPGRCATWCRTMFSSFSA